MGGLTTLILLCSCSVWEPFFKGIMVQEYLELVRYVLENGAKKTDRTGTGTLSLFGLQTRYDLRKGFPLLTTKKVLFDAVVRELLWFLRGSTNIHDGLTQYTPIWNPWADGLTTFHSESEAGLSMAAIREAARTDAALAKRLQQFLFRTPEELYDFETDRNSLVNLADHPDRAGELATLRRRLGRWMDRYDDPLDKRFAALLA